MTLVVTHKIAGITLRGEADVPIPHLLDAPFPQFWVGDAEEPDVRYHIRQLETAPQTFPPLTAQERAWLARTLNFPQHLMDRAVLRLPAVRAVLHDCPTPPEWVRIGLRWNRVIVRDFARNELHFFYPPEEKDSFAEPIIVARYRNLLAGFLPSFSAMIVHSSGVIRNAMAMLFLAQDEGGKTTVVEHSQDAPILNDDHIVLRRGQNGIYAHGTPFGPLTSGPQSARLGGIFLLDKSPRFELTAIPAEQALQFLWREHLHVHATLPKPLKARAFELLAEACHQARTYRMSFPKDYVDWRALDAAVASRV